MLITPASSPASVRTRYPKCRGPLVCCTYARKAALVRGGEASPRWRLRLLATAARNSACDLCDGLSSIPVIMSAHQTASTWPGVSHAGLRSDAVENRALRTAGRRSVQLRELHGLPASNPVYRCC